MSSPLMTHQVHLPAIKAIVWERPLRVQGKIDPDTAEWYVPLLGAFQGPIILPGFLSYFP